MPVLYCPVGLLLCQGHAPTTTSRVSVVQTAWHAVPLLVYVDTLSCPDACSCVQGNWLVVALLSLGGALEATSLCVSDTHAEVAGRLSGGCACAVALCCRSNVTTTSFGCGNLLHPLLTCVIIRTTTGFSSKVGINICGTATALPDLVSLAHCHGRSIKCTVCLVLVLLFPCPRCVK